mmetsp:Transcript_6581/g.10752  ORF Transcript_6581/g.10752 Transcript_6581/m.10752 type:complete len:169 (+) Transcript_6581:149-655(+)
MTSIGRRVKANINERRVRRHNTIQDNLNIDGQNVEDVYPEVPLEFPCRDSSKGVTDFRDWSYFKNLEKKKIVNIGCTAMWSKKYLDMLNERKIDSLKSAAANKKNKKLPAVKTTKAQRMREKYNDQISSSYAPVAIISNVSAFADSDSWSGNDSVFGAKVNGPRFKLP